MKTPEGRGTVERGIHWVRKVFIEEKTHREAFWEKCGQTLAGELAKKGAGGDQGASRARESQRSGLRVFISCQGGGSHCSLAAGGGWIRFCLRRTAPAEQWRSMRSGARAVGRFDEGNWNRNRGVRESGRANKGSR